MVPVLNETFLMLVWLIVAACGLLAINDRVVRTFAWLGPVTALAQEASSGGLPLDRLTSSLEQRAGPCGLHDRRAVLPGVRLPDAFESALAGVSGRPVMRVGSPPPPRI